MSRIEELQNIVQLSSSLLQMLKPAPDLKVWEWASEYRVMSNEETSAPGPWDNGRTPYLVEIMDKLTDPAVSKIVFLAARQMGKSTVFLNFLGYMIHMNPSPVVIIQPTVDLAEKFSQTRVSNMFRDTPCLKGLVPSDKTRDSANKILYKEGKGWFLILTGANSTSGIISMPVPILYFDEIDQYVRDLQNQGNVISIAEKMQTNFPNRKSIYTSTPTVKGKSQIEAAYETSTMKRWCHECPACKAWSQFGLKGEETPDNNKVVWLTRLNFENMKMVCPRCLAEHTRREWEASGGQWIAQAPDSKIEGYHINAFDHPSITWEMIVEEFREATNATKRNDFSLLITFINSRLCESFEERGEVVESHALEARREVYNAELPDGVCVLTMGVDVQHNRLACGVWGWGMGLENWLIEYTEFWGDPRQGEVWGRIDDLLSRYWSYGNGKRIRISRTGVDTGDGNLSPQIMSYCNARQTRGVYAVKGQGGDRIPLARPSKAARERQIFLVGVDGIKADIMSWLRIDKPGDGYCHFPIGNDGQPINGCTTDFFAMLTAEKRVIRQDKKGFSKYEWIKPAGARNEALDVFVYSRAALRIMSPNDELMLKRLFLSVPWDAKALLETGKGKTDITPQVRNKPKNRVSLNARAREHGISL